MPSFVKPGQNIPVITHTYALFAGFSVDLVIDFRECFGTVELVPHGVVECVIKHGAELLMRQVRICIQHLEPENKK